ncbi:putative odorant receptor 92a [Rhynchophorus ferrugineus]|uniref:putative odorant receptor 92a n=1 Tax=Rhynchophorus ferrugineus TaxID=354439 RepID=UPI003FCED66D
MTDNERLIKITKWFMILTGFWIKPLNVGPTMKKIYSAYIVAVRIGLVSLWLLLAIELFRLIIQKYELEIVMSTIGVLIGVTKIQIKFIIFIKNKVVDLYEVVIENESKIWRSNNKEIKELYTKNVIICRYFMFVQMLGTAFAVTSLTITGILGNNDLIKYNHLHNTSLESHFIFQIYFPVNKLDHLVSFYLLMVMYVWCAFIFNNASHMIVTNLLLFCSTRLAVLQIKMRNVVRDRNPEEYNQMLKKLIVEHVSIIQFISTLNSRNKYLLMLEFVLSSLDVASAASNVTKTKTSDLSWYTVFFLLLTAQIFLLTWNANEIKEQSLAIADSIFTSDWYLLDKDNLKLIQLIIIRAQKPLVVTIGPFAPMTTTSALLMFKAAYSYISIMQ